MENISVILIATNFFLLIFMFTAWMQFKNRSDGPFKEELNKITQYLADYQDRQKQYQSQEFQNLRTSVDKKLGEGLDKSHAGLTQVLERLAKIDQAQKTIEGLGQNVVQLQNVLTDKKSRGIFGEVQLAHLLETAFGSAQGRVYDLQKTLSNGKIVDAALYLPEPLGLLAVDSKFPLENYRRMVDGESSAELRGAARKEFAKNFKKHVDDIHNKYIIMGETSPQAIMFLPAEAIFAELYARHPELVEYSMAKNIWVTGPTTFMATMTTVQALLVNIERSKKMDVIHEEINKLGKEFLRYEDRWEDYAKHVQTVLKDMDKLEITHRKLNDKFKTIMDA